jgi:hypothetical protein
MIGAVDVRHNNKIIHQSNVIVIGGSYAISELVTNNNNSVYPDEWRIGLGDRNLTPIPGESGVYYSSGLVESATLSHSSSNSDSMWQSPASNTLAGAANDRQLKTNTSLWAAGGAWNGWVIAFTDVFGTNGAFTATWSIIKNYTIGATGTVNVHYPWVEGSTPGTGLQVILIRPARVKFTASFDSTEYDGIGDITLYETSLIYYRNNIETLIARALLSSSISRSDGDDIDVTWYIYAV